MQHEERELQTGLAYIGPFDHEIPDLEQSLQDFHANFAPAPVENKVNSWSWLRMWWMGPLMAGAMAVAFLVVPMGSNPSHSPTRMAKGGFVHLWYTGPSMGFQGRRKVQNGDTLYPSTQIQFQVHLQKKFVILLMMNQQGEVTVLLPGKETVSASPSSKARTVGPFELDDYMGQERVFAVASEKSLSVKRVKAAFQRSFVESKKSLLAVAPTSPRWKVAWSVWYHKQRLSSQGGRTTP